MDYYMYIVYTLKYIILINTNKYRKLYLIALEGDQNSSPI